MLAMGEVGGPHIKAGGAPVEIRGLSKQFGSVRAVDSVSINVAAGEFIALLGPSGSGKSTVLMSIAGFELPNSGQILIGGRDCTRLPPHKRNIGMVFQHYTLFPHLSVLDNVAFPLKMRGIAKDERRRRAARALEVVRLGGYGERMPKQLSGGQQQRVALARAIVYEPQLLLMDEPLSALDKNLREEMQLEIKRLHSELGITIIFVTHDQSEALTMADRVAILQSGRVAQISGARDLYERPTSLFAAGFIGEMNMIEASWNGTEATFAKNFSMALPSSAVIDDVAAGPVMLTVRPERVEVMPEGTPGTASARVDDVVYAGAGTLVIASMACGGTIRARKGSADLSTIREGDRVGIKFPADAVLIYPRQA